jgi:hypothetical protein
MSVRRDGRVKGIIFNLLEDAVSSEFGAAAWDGLLAAVGSDGVYTSLGSYPDSQVRDFLGAAAARLGKTPEEMLRWFGNAAMPLLYERYPRFFAGHTSTRAFILSVNEIIHPEVLKIYPGADVPFFEFRDAEDGGLLMGYRSPRRLCRLAQGFAEGAAQHFGQAITFTHLKCMHNGDESCLCHIAFGS